MGCGCCHRAATAKVEIDLVIIVIVFSIVYHFFTACCVLGVSRHRCCGFATITGGVVHGCCRGRRSRGSLGGVIVVVEVGEEVLLKVLGFRHGKVDYAVLEGDVLLGEKPVTHLRVLPKRDSLQYKK